MVAGAWRGLYRETRRRCLVAALAWQVMPASQGLQTIRTSESDSPPRPTPHERTVGKKRRAPTATARHGAVQRVLIGPASESDSEPHERSADKRPSVARTSARAGKTPINIKTTRLFLWPIRMVLKETF